MADQPRVHPVAQDVEAPAAPLVPRESSKSEHGSGGAAPAPAPRYLPPPYKKRRSCCCRLFCCVFSLILSLVIIIGILVGVFFLVFNPKLPKYSIDKLAITQFNVSNNSTLEATFNVTITARNPNKKIGIYYESGSNIGVWYESTKISQGSLPKFYQGHRNTTVLDLTLTGQTELQDTDTLMKLQEQNGGIPLRIKVKQPIKIKLGKLKLMKMNFKVRCKLTVTSALAVSSAITFTDSSCSFRLR